VPIKHCPVHFELVTQDLPASDNADQPITSSPNTRPDKGNVADSHNSLSSVVPLEVEILAPLGSEDHMRGISAAMLTADVRDFSVRAKQNRFTGVPNSTAQISVFKLMNE
jgi:hypothetical protein